MNHTPFATVAVFLFSYSLYLLWLAFIHQVRGENLSKEGKKSSGITFSTNQGDFFIDSVTKGFKYRPKGENGWKSIAFDAITGIRYVVHADSASWFEFFLSDWDLWDLSGRYRDITNIATVELRIAGGSLLPLVELRQYEQRELWLGQWSYELHIALIKKLGLYHPLEEVTEAWIDALCNKCEPLGLQLERV